MSNWLRPRDNCSRQLVVNSHLFGWNPLSPSITNLWNLQSFRSGKSVIKILGDKNYCFTTKTPSLLLLCQLSPSKPAFKTVLFTMFSQGTNLRQSFLFPKEKEALSVDCTLRSETGFRLKCFNTGARVACAHVRPSHPTTFPCLTWHYKEGNFIWHDVMQA